MIVMGLECPNGHGRQNVVLNITPGMVPTAKASEVVAKKLACGCVVSGEEYQDFLTAVHKIDLDEQKAIEQIKKNNASKRSAAYQGMAKSKGA